MSAIQSYVTHMLITRADYLASHKKPMLQSEDATRDEWYAANAKAENIIDSLLCLYFFVKDSQPEDAKFIKDQLGIKYRLLANDIVFFGCVEEATKKLHRDIPCLDHNFTV